MRSFWERRRLDLLGREKGHREDVAPQLGISVRSIVRYQCGSPPAWNELALMGLAERYITQLL